MSQRKKYRQTFITQWRQHKHLTQEQLASRVGMTQAQISQLENGKRGYTQETLEAIADALSVDTASLIMRNPDDREAIWSIWDRAKVEQRRMITDIAETILKTGT
jgi:transcriptional regulator with XRE-family HTH domain